MFKEQEREEKKGFLQLDGNDKMQAVRIPLTLTIEVLGSKVLYLKVAYIILIKTE